MAAFLRMPDVNERIEALKLLVKEREISYRFAAQLVLSLPQSAATDKLLGYLITEWVRWDADEAMTYCESLPQERLNTTTCANSALGFSQLPAQRVATFANRLDDHTRAMFMENLASGVDEFGSWRNTQRIMELTLPTADKASFGHFRLSMDLANASPEQALQWVQAEADPIKRDGLISGYTRCVEAADPVAALRWDAEMNSPETRDSEMQRHLLRWLETERDAALNWLQSNEATAIVDTKLRANFLRSYHLEATK